MYNSHRSRDRQDRERNGKGLALVGNGCCLQQQEGHLKLELANTHPDSAEFRMCGEGEPLEFPPPPSPRSLKLWCHNASIATIGSIIIDVMYYSCIIQLQTP